VRLDKKADQWSPQTRHCNAIAGAKPTHTNYLHDSATSFSLQLITILVTSVMSPLLRMNKILFSSPASHHLVHAAAITLDLRN
jgi:hypothetical protein